MRITWSLLLPLFLVLAQQGELRHEIGHLSDPPASSQKQKSGDSKPCEVCLAYSHLAGATQSPVFAPPLLGNLAFHYALEPRIYRVDAASLAPRSRGPPVSC